MMVFLKTLSIWLVLLLKLLRKKLLQKQKPKLTDKKTRIYNGTTIHLEVVTPAGAVVNEEVDIVNAPGYGGDFGVLANHAPFLSTIKIGLLTYEQGKDRKSLMISGGFSEVSNNKLLSCRKRRGW